MRKALLLLVPMLVLSFLMIRSVAADVTNPTHSVVGTWLPPPWTGRSILLLDDAGEPGPEGKQALDIFGYPYVQVTATGFASVNLNDYDVMFVAWLGYGHPAAAQAEVDALYARKADIDAWISNGGGIVVNAEDAWVTNPYSFLPGTPSFATDNTIHNLNGVHIVLSWHYLVSGLTDADLSNWGNSVHGKLTSVPSGADVVAVATELGDSPQIVGLCYGRGRIVVCDSDPEYHTIYGVPLGHPNPDAPRILLYKELSWAMRIPESVVPEVPLGTVISAVAMIFGLVAYVGIRPLGIFRRRH